MSVNPISEDGKGEIILHLFYKLILDYPISRLLLEGYTGEVKYAQFLHDRSELQFGKTRANVTYQEDLDEKDVILMLPDVKPDVEIPVIEVILNE